MPIKKIIIIINSDNKFRISKFRSFLFFSIVYRESVTS